MNRFNFISTWVASEILMCGNESERVKVLEKFIGLAVALRSLQNFHSMIAVYSALNMHSIQRLSRTWKVKKTKNENLLNFQTLFGIYFFDLECFKKIDWND